MFIAVFLAFVFVVFLYFRTKNTTSAVYELGRRSLAARDPFDFMELPYSALRSPADKAIFHFMTQRPWQESEAWFHNFITSKRKAEQDSSNPEVSQYAFAMYESMVGPAPLEEVLTLQGLPMEVRRDAPAAYSSWASKHQRMLRLSHLRVGDFVAESSKAAAAACVRR